MMWPLCTCGHAWDWHGPSKDCIGCGCMWFRAQIYDRRPIAFDVATPILRGECPKIEAVEDDRVPERMTDRG